MGASSSVQFGEGTLIAGDDSAYLGHHKLSGLFSTPVPSSSSSAYSRHPYNGENLCFFVGQQNHHQALGILSKIKRQEVKNPALQLCYHDFRTLKFRHEMKFCILTLCSFCELKTKQLSSTNSPRLFCLKTRYSFSQRCLYIQSDF